MRRPADGFAYRGGLLSRVVSGARARDAVADDEGNQNSAVVGFFLADNAHAQVNTLGRGVKLCERRLQLVSGPFKLPSLAALAHCQNVVGEGVLRERSGNGNVNNLEGAHSSVFLLVGRYLTVFNVSHFQFVWSINQDHAARNVARD